MRVLGWICIFLGVLLAIVLIIFSLGFLPSDAVVLRDSGGTPRVELAVWSDGSPSLIFYPSAGVRERATLSTAALIAGFGVVILALRPSERKRARDRHAVEEGRKACPQCAAVVDAMARVCLFCSYPFPLAELPLEQFASSLGEMIDQYWKEINAISEEALAGGEKHSTDEIRGKVADVQNRVYRELMERYGRLILGATGMLERELVARLNQIKETKERAAMLNEVISAMLKPLPRD